MKTLIVVIFTSFLLCLNSFGFAQGTTNNSNSEYMAWYKELKQRLELTPTQAVKADKLFEMSNEKVNSPLLPVREYNNLNEMEKKGYQKEMLQKEYRATKEAVTKLKGMLNENQVKELMIILKEKAQKMDAELKALG